MKSENTDITRNRHGGNPESIAAFEAIRNSLPQQRSTVLQWIEAAHDGLTCKELAAAWGVGMNVISGRFSELKRDGLIAKRGTRGGCGVMFRVKPLETL